MKTKEQILELRNQGKKIKNSSLHKLIYCEKNIE